MRRSSPRELPRRSIAVTPTPCMTGVLVSSCAKATSAAAGGSSTTGRRDRAGTWGRGVDLMRFTLNLSHHPWTRDRDGQAPRQTLRVAHAADAAGIDAIWASEDPEGWDAFAVLSAIAAVTEGADLGTSVTSPYPRHPNLLAASVATLDRISGGRAVLGLGRGQAEWHRDALGIDTGDPLAVLEETVALLRQWWQPPHRASSPDKGHFRVRGWERVIHPRQGHVPVYLAAAERKAIERGKNLLALVATLPGMDRSVRAEGFDVSALLDEVRVTMGTRETLVAGGGFPALRRDGDLAAARALIPDDLIRHLSVIGSLPVVRERLRALDELGVTHIGVTPPPEA